MFLVNVAHKKLVEHTRKPFYEKLKFDEKSTDRGLVGGIQISGFRDLLVWKATKKQ